MEGITQEAVDVYNAEGEVSNTIAHQAAYELGLDLERTTLDRLHVELDLASQGPLGLVENRVVAVWLILRWLGEV